MQVAIVTGGSSGIGRSAATRIAACGTGVVLTYRSSPGRAQETVGMIEDGGGTAVALPLDVGRAETFPAFREAVVVALRETWRRDDVDFLVNNAGLAAAAPFADTTGSRGSCSRAPTSSPRPCCRSSPTAVPS